MEDYPYDTSLEWVPREYPDDNSIGYPAPPQRASRPPQWNQYQPQAQASPHRQYQPQAQASPRQQHRQYQPQPRQAARPDAKGARMSKAEALNLLESIKKTILIGALIAFGVLSGLVATHLVGSAANNASPSPSANPAQQQNPSTNGGFFNQQGGGGGYQFGPGGSQPSSGTRTS
jgi:hypothetical protein